MSIEVIYHPDKASKKLLRAFLLELGFEPCGHLWSWSKGSIHFHWFKSDGYESYDGVEATIFPPNEGLAPGSLPTCDWALHTRTRASASPEDRRQQNKVIRTARARFGGGFYNDSEGRNRYIKVVDDGRSAPDRGVFIAYQSVTESISSVKFAIPDPIPAFQQLAQSNLKDLAQIDPTRVLYNALVPFAVATVENFLSRTFKALLKFDPKTREKLRAQTRKVALEDAIAVADGDMSIEDVVVGWYSFQNIDSTQKAFKEWLGIDFRGALRKRTKIGRRFTFLDEELVHMIEARHGVVHRLDIDRTLQKHGINELLDISLALVDAFVDYLETDRFMHVRD